MQNYYSPSSTNVTAQERQRSANRRRSSVMDYEQSIMFGQYREDLANFALAQAEKLTALQEDRNRQSQNGRGLEGNSGGGGHPKSPSMVMKLIRKVFKSGGDMIFFTILAITLATLSFSMDIAVHAFFELRNYLTNQLTTVFFYSLALWMLFTVLMVLAAATVTRFLAPQAAGSGVSEMKVVLRGVVLKEYLNMKTLVAKVVGLTFTLGSGLPLGKEGPFVHISSMAANQFMKLFSNITDPQEYESRFFEVIAVACGLGVAVTFASPVGGVLYSIEIVSVFFSVRSYWQGFFAATVGALFWRLLTVWFAFEESITHIFKTDFRLEHPYETLELISFALLGILCGLSAYLFVALNRAVVLFNRRRNPMNDFFRRWPLMYPVALTTLIAFVSFPGTLGQFYASWLNSEQSMHELFSNFSWHSLEGLIDQDEIVDHWRTPYTNVFVNVFLFFVMNLVVVAVGATMPIPLGLIVPSFKIGAGLGRFYGECMSYFFPKGINPFQDRSAYPILAGAYSVAGSAAFAGANTGALSSAVIAFEMTGQVTHLLPVIVAILCATITARLFCPSIYDSLIILKKLPYLPSILPSSSTGHRIFVEDFMERDLLFVFGKCTYRYLRHLLSSKVGAKLRIFPFVRSPESMILLGTVERTELQALLDNHLSRQRMVFELRKSMQSLSAQVAANCPVHGPTVAGSQPQHGQLGSQPSLPGSQNRRFQVNAVAEPLPADEPIEVTSLGTVAWEEEQLDVRVDFTNCPIDPAPFQLMEGTSLLKVHNLFSLLGLQLAYVTSLGTLVGCVGLKELRKAIEEMEAGHLPKTKSRSNGALNEDIQEEDEEEEEEEEEEEVAGAGAGGQRAVPDDEGPEEAEVGGSGVRPDRPSRHLLPPPRRGGGGGQT